MAYQSTTADKMIPGNSFNARQRVNDTAKCMTYTGRLVIAISKECIIEGAGLYRTRLAPIIHKSSGFVRQEAIEIHHRQNWFKRCGVTLFDNALGLGIAMLAARIVQDQVEVEHFSNLWGLLATRPVVSESTYELINFGVEFVIALIVFTLTEHYLEEFRARKKPADTADSEIPEIEITGN